MHIHPHAAECPRRQDAPGGRAEQARHPFTPGPWEIGDTKAGYCDIDATGLHRIPWQGLARVVVQMEGAFELEDYPQGQANARLIAAAPELYEALAELHRSCMGTPVGGGDGGTYVVGRPTAAILNKANSALRKARGEA